MLRPLTSCRMLYVMLYIYLHPCPHILSPLYRPGRAAAACHFLSSVVVSVVVVVIIVIAGVGAGAGAEEGAGE